MKCMPIIVLMMFLVACGRSEPTPEQAAAVVEQAMAEATVKAAQRADLNAQSAAEVQAQIAAVESRIEDAKRGVDDAFDDHQKALASARMVEKFSIRSARFYWSDNEIMEQPVIELAVGNGTGKAISKVDFNATLRSAGRSIPWVKDRFQYSISGGLEPGETATWKLIPNMFGDWQRLPKERSDYLLDITIAGLYDSNGKQLEVVDPSIAEKRLGDARKNVQDLEVQRAGLLAKLSALNPN